jgi:hypothetical protein
MPTQTTSLGRALADYLREQADWRGHKAEEYPDDARNKRSAATLAGLADYVESAPLTNPALTEIGRLADAHGLVNGRFFPGEEAGRLISQFGFHQPEASMDALLSLLAGTIRREEEADDES